MEGWACVQQRVLRSQFRMNIQTHNGNNSSLLSDTQHQCEALEWKISTTTTTTTHLLSIVWSRRWALCTLLSTYGSSRWSWLRTIQRLYSGAIVIDTNTSAQADKNESSIWFGGWVQARCCLQINGVENNHQSNNRSTTHKSKGMMLHLNSFAFLMIPNEYDIL